MNLFASETQSQPLPIGDGQSFIVRALTGAEVDEARAAHVHAFQSGKSERGSAAMLNQILSGKATDEDLRKMQRDPLRDVDRVTVARLGLVSWTLGYSIKPYMKPPTEQEKADGVTPRLVDPIADLLDTPLEVIALAVAKQTWPERFLTDEEQKADEKKA